MILSTPSSDYPTFLSELKTRIRQAQLNAVLSVNKELTLLYWKIGKDILMSQEKLGWGAKVIDQLSQDLRNCSFAPTYCITHTCR
jgi:hypothetical protein